MKLSHTKPSDLEVHLPEGIDWSPPSPDLSHGYRHILVCHHKHSRKDWEISFGKIVPYDNYKKYRIMIYVPLCGGEWQVINTNEVIRVGQFGQYGYVDENNSG